MAVAAGADDIDDRTAGVDVHHVRAHRRHHAGDLCRRLTLCSEEAKEGGRLARVDTLDDGAAAGLGFGARQIAPLHEVLDDGFECGGGHCYWSASE